MKVLLSALTSMFLSSILAPIQAWAGEYGGFTYKNIQEFDDYVQSQEMFKVQADEMLDQAIDEIPINLETVIDLEQERGLRDWLRQYLVAFSESGNDSLAAIFYLRAGFNKEQYKKVKLALAGLMQQRAKNRNTTVRNEDGSIMTDEQIENIVEDARDKIEVELMKAPISIFRSSHRRILDSTNKKYFIENVSFYDSEFRVFELKKEDSTFLSLAKDRGMLPRGYIPHNTALTQELPALLETGTRIICVDIMFIVEEPPESAYDSTMPRRTPSFFRLMWDSNRKLWRHLEVFYSPGVNEGYFFRRL